MTELALPAVSLMLGAAMLLALWRLLRGPEWIDRILALDTLYINGLALVVLLGMQFDTTLFFEAALLIAMLGFVGTISLAKYLLRRDIIE
jgi:multicomponent K+:H+ antiporter subunit F